MTNVSRADRRTDRHIKTRTPQGAALAAFVLGLLSSVSTFAQTNTGAATVPLFSAAQPATVDSQGAPATPDTRSSIQGIEVQSLGSVDAAAVGLIDAHSGGLPLDVWQKSHPDMPGLLISKLPDGIASPALRALTVRLLVTAAPLARRPGNIGGTLAAREFMAKRIDRLVALGASEEAVALADSIPFAERGPKIDRAALGAALVSGRIDTACTSGTAQIASTGQAPADDNGFTQRLQVFCQIRAGDLAGAELSTQLLRDLGQASPLFLDLADALTTGYAVNLSNVTSASALEEAMLSQLGQTATNVARPSLTVMEDQVVRGVGSPVDLSEAYASADVSASALADPVAAAATLDGPEARALLYQAATIQSVPAAKVELVRAALESAERDGVLISLAPAFAPLIDPLKADNSLWRFAGLAARFHYAVNRPERARPWHGVLRTRTLNDPNAASENARLWPYAVLSGAQSPDSVARGLGAAAQVWRQSVVANQEASGHAPDRALILMSALDQSIEGLAALHAFADDRSKTGSDKPALDALLLEAMRSAARVGRTGEAILFSALALGGRSSETVDAASIAAIVSVLNGLGLSSDAHALALEALP